MGVTAGDGLLFGSIGFAAAGLVLGAIIAIYVKQRTKDQTMSGTNAM